MSNPITIESIPTCLSREAISRRLEELQDSINRRIDRLQRISSDCKNEELEELRYVRKAYAEVYAMLNTASDGNSN